MRSALDRIRQPPVVGPVIHKPPVVRSEVQAELIDPPPAPPPAIVVQQLPTPLHTQSQPQPKTSVGLWIVLGILAGGFVLFWLLIAVAIIVDAATYDYVETWIYR